MSNPTEISKTVFGAAVIMSILFSIACEDGGSTKDVLPRDGEVLATVNGEPVSRYDVELSLLTEYGPGALQTMDENDRQKVLEGLIYVKAMAQKSEKDLTHKEQAALEKKVAAYREKQLVRLYVDKHAGDTAVTPREIEEFYKETPQRFGGLERRTFELLASHRGLTSGERETLLERTGGIAKVNDWEAWARENQDLPLQYRSGVITELLLPEKLVETAQNLDLGATAPLTFSNGRAYLLRVTGVKQVPPKPLEQVQKTIRKELEARNRKRLLKKVAKEVMEKADVERKSSLKTVSSR